MHKPSEAWSRKGKNYGLQGWMVIHFSHEFIDMTDSYIFPFGAVGRSLAPPFPPLPFSALPTGGGR